MLPADTFACSSHQGVVVCQAKTKSGENVYQQLAARVKAVMAQMARAGIPAKVQEITIGPTIGAAMVIAVQGIVGALAIVAQPPNGIRPLLSTQTPPGQLVSIVGTYADEIVAYIDNVLMAKPDVFHVIQQPAPPIGSPAQQAVRFFTLDRVVAIGASVAVVGGLIFLARSSDKRLSGKVDRTRFLFPENAGGDDDEGLEGDDEGAELPPDVIDAESVEVESPAP